MSSEAIFGLPTFGVAATQLNVKYSFHFSYLVSHIQVMPPEHVLLILMKGEDFISCYIMSHSFVLFFAALRPSTHASHRLSLQEVLKVELKRGSREGELEVLEHDGVHDTEAADLHGLLVGELEEDGGGVAGEVGGVCDLC